MSDVRTPGLATVINEARARLMVDLRVSCPGKIVRFDSTTLLADVAPLTLDPVEQEDGSSVSMTLPVVTNVPVQFPGAGGMRITFPVQVGDPCFLLFSDRSLDAWIARGGVTDPPDQRRHHLSDAVALLGVRSTPETWKGFDPTSITIGSETGTPDFVALSTAVTTALTTLHSAISSAVIVPNDGGASFKTTLLAALASWPAPVGSTTVKVNG